VQCLYRVQFVKYSCGVQRNTNVSKALTPLRSKGESLVLIDLQSLKCLYSPPRALIGCSQIAILICCAQLVLTRCLFDICFCYVWTTGFSFLACFLDGTPTRRKDMQAGNDCRVNFIWHEFMAY